MSTPTIATLKSLMIFMNNYTLVAALVILFLHLCSKKYLHSVAVSFIILIPVIVAFFMFPINYSWYGMDYTVYAMSFDQATTISLEGHDALLGVLMYAVKQITSDVHIFFAITSSLYVGIYVWACKRFTNGGATLSLFALCFCVPFFLGYMDNTLRAGLAIALTLLAYSYIEESRLKAAIIAILAVNFHYSTLLPIVTLAISYYYTKPKLFLWIWGACVLASLAAGSFFQTYFSGMVDDSRMSGYLMQTEDDYVGIYKVGFRWDFVVYSLIPLVAGWYYVVKKQFNDHLYKTIYSAYILSNAFWLLVIRAPFSDRFAYLSWFMMPIILAYPVLKRDTPIVNHHKLYCASLAVTILFKIYI